MKLHLTAQSERGKPVTKSGNYNLKSTFSLNRENIVEVSFKAGNIDSQGGYWLKIIGKDIDGDGWRVLYQKFYPDSSVELREPKTAHKCETIDEQRECAYGKPKTARECEHTWIGSGINITCSKCKVTK